MFAKDDQQRIYNVYLHCVSKRTRHPLVTVNSSNRNRFSFFSLLESLLNYQQNGYNSIHHTKNVLATWHYLKKLKCSNLLYFVVFYTQHNR